MLVSVVSDRDLEPMEKFFLLFIRPLVPRACVRKLEDRV